MPRPPPPAAAFTSTGKPISRAAESASASEATPPRRSRHDGNAEALGRALCFDLVAHQPDMFGLGANEMHTVLDEDFGKARILGEEAVARMHGVGAGDLACGDQRRNIEIAVARGRRPDADAFVGEPDMHGIGVRRRMNRNGRNAEILAGAQYA